MDDDNDIQPLFTISHISEESQILNSIENFETLHNVNMIIIFKNNVILNICHPDRCLYILWKNLVTVVEIFPRKSLNINKNLENSNKKS